jgi:hypothetical protein
VYTFFKAFRDSCLTNLISVTCCTWILSQFEPQYFVEEEEKEEEEEEEEDLRTCLFHVQALGVPKHASFLQLSICQSMSVSSSFAPVLSRSIILEYS